MAHIRLIHWNAAEGDERAAELRRAGYEVDYQAAFGPLDLRAMRERPPEAFVIDLARTPSQGRDVALALRQQKATRAAPLVFVQGDPEKTARVRQLLPDAFYTPRPGVGRTLERPLRQLPEGVRIARTGRGRPQLILLFTKSRADLERRFPAAARALAGGGGLWIVWPKNASGVVTDLSEHAVRGFGLAAGFVDYKVCAVDQTWSGLLFARRRKLLRHKENR